MATNSGPIFHISGRDGPRDPHQRICHTAACTMQCMAWPISTRNMDLEPQWCEKRPLSAECPFSGKGFVVALGGVAFGTLPVAKGLRAPRPLTCVVLRRAALCVVLRRAAVCVVVDLEGSVPRTVRKFSTMYSSLMKKRKASSQSSDSSTRWSRARALQSHAVLG